MKELEQYIATYFGIENENLGAMADFFKEEKVKKNEVILRIGQRGSSLSFIKSGYVRFYAYSEDGRKEITQWIASKDMFVAELQSLLFGKPSRLNIETLSDCELYTIKKKDYDQLDSVVPNWQVLEKLFLAKCFMTLEQRVFNQISKTAEENYNELFAYNPTIFNHVPLQYIASMLGMSPETLSRIRKKQSS